jgi:hypothetical protein
MQFSLTGSIYNVSSMSVVNEGFVLNLTNLHSLMAAYNITAKKVDTKQITSDKNNKSWPAEVASSLQN